MYVEIGNVVSRLCLKLILHEKFDMKHKARFTSIIRDGILFQPRAQGEESEHPSIKEIAVVSSKRENGLHP